MNTLTKIAPAVLFLFLVAASGCDTLDNDEPEVAAITPADAETASLLVAESLSDENEGMMASLNDMTANVGAQGLSYDRRRFLSDPLLRPCRGTNREYEKTYDPESGVHTITYSKNHEGANCEKSVEVTLNYTFLDAANMPIEFPRLQADETSEIAFEGERVGSGTFTNRRGMTRSRSFEQTGNWNLSGLLTNVASLDGEQISDGEYTYTLIDEEGNEEVRSGTYHVELRTVDVTYEQAEAESDLENQLTGSLQYVIVMTRTVNGETETRETEGTIELEGNGRALLRFNGLRQLYRVHLASGDVDVEEDNS